MHYQNCKSRYSVIFPIAVLVLLMSNSLLAQKLVPIELKLPKPMFIGTPQNMQVPNLEKPLGKPRPPFLAPEGTKNVALNILPSSTDEEPIIG